MALARPALFVVARESGPGAWGACGRFAVRCLQVSIVACSVNICGGAYRIVIASACTTKNPTGWTEGGEVKDIDLQSANPRWSNRTDIAVCVLADCFQAFAAVSRFVGQSSGSWPDEDCL